MMRGFLNIIANILGIVGFALSLCIACRIFPTNDKVCFDYQGILVGIMSLIFAMLVGWNIFQALDIRSSISNLEGLKKEVDDKLHDIQNKNEYNHALTNLYISQVIAFSYISEKDEASKYNMIVRGINALKILAKNPSYKVEVEKLMKSLKIGMNNSKEIKLTNEQVRNLIMLCGTFEDKDDVAGFSQFIDLLEQCRKS